MPALCALLPGTSATPRGSRRRFCSLGGLGAFRGAAGVRRGGCSVAKPGYPLTAPREAPRLRYRFAPALFVCAVSAGAHQEAGALALVPLRTQAERPELGSCEVAPLFLGA